MKYIFLTVLFLLVNKVSLGHEMLIDGLVKHAEYLEKSQVKSFGDLRLIKENKLNQSFPYSKIKSDDLYGIGMPTGLDKELMVTSGTLYESYFEHHKYHAETVNEERDIAFMVYANVKHWKTIKLPDTVNTFSQLEKAMPKLAEDAGINSNHPFPFVLHAKTEGLKWFIVNGMGNGKPDYLSAFLRSRYIGGLDNVNIEGIGFYSKKQKGVITAPNSHMHIHFRTLTEPLFVGHIDNEINLAKGGTLKFPLLD